MKKDAHSDILKLKVDGGACANDYLMQFQSDILDVDVIRPINKESTAMGAAYLAGLYLKMWDEKEIIRNITVDKVFKSTFSEEERSTRYSVWKKGVDRTMGWLESDGVDA